MYVQLAEQLSDSAVMYAVIKDDESGSRCTLIKWLGKDVPALRRAGVGPHLAAVQELVRVSGGSVECRV